jgi:hypothetical protein
VARPGFPTPQQLETVGDVVTKELAEENESRADDYTARAWGQQPPPPVFEEAPSSEDPSVGPNEDPNEDPNQDSGAGVGVPLLAAEASESPAEASDRASRSRALSIGGAADDASAATKLRAALAASEWDAAELDEVMAQLRELKLNESVELAGPTARRAAGTLGGSRLGGYLASWSEHGGHLASAYYTFLIWQAEAAGALCSRVAWVQTRVCEAGCGR